MRIPIIKYHINLNNPQDMSTKILANNQTFENSKTSQTHERSSMISENFEIIDDH